MSSRKILSMDHDWSFQLGRQDVKNGKSHTDIYNMSKSGNCPGVPQESFDTSGWSTVDLPHDWSAEQEFDEKDGTADWGYKPGGCGWYRKVFTLGDEYKGKELTVCFEGIATCSVVYFNGSVIHRNYSAYTPFEIDITDRANFGDVPNVLAVFVDADSSEGWWYQGAGMYGHVYMKVKNYVHIPEHGLAIRIVEKEKNTWQVNLTVNIVNMTFMDRELQIETTLVDPDKDLEVNINNNGVLCEAGQESQVETEFTIEDPKRWDIDEPNTYNVITKLYDDGELIDSEKTVCGFRTVSVDPNRGFFLNGRHVKIMGACCHMDFSGLGIAVPDSIWDYRVERLKAMGCNAYRCAHGMAPRGLVEACDRLGMMVVDENRHFDTSEEGLTELREMVLRDRNHPCVIMYSLFNEEPLEDTEAGRRMVRRMSREIYLLDQSRYITGAMNSGIIDGCGLVDELDICGINYQPEIYDSFHKAYPDKPLLVTETAASFSVRGCYRDDEESHMISSYDERHAEWGTTLREALGKIMSEDYILGGFIWSGFDYLGEPTPYEWPSVSSYFGLMDTCGFAKEGYFLAKSFFLKRPFCHVLPHWNHSGLEGKNIRVMSHTNCEEAELFVNRVSMGRKKIDPERQEYWEVPYEPGYIELIGYNRGLKCAHDVRITTGRPSRLKVVPWRSKMYGDGFDAIPVKIAAVDKKGHEVPDANFQVDINVTGGKILATANGDPTCHESFKGSKRSLFNGRCQVIVKADSGSSQMVITVGAENIGVGTIVIPLLRRKKIPEIRSIHRTQLKEWSISDFFSLPSEAKKELDDFDHGLWKKITIQKDMPGTKISPDKIGKVVIYRAVTHISSDSGEKGTVIHFESLGGICSIYVNGLRRAEVTNGWPLPYDLTLKPGDQGKIDIIVVVKILNEDSGIHESVIVK